MLHNIGLYTYISKGFLACLFIDDDDNDNHDDGDSDDDDNRVNGVNMTGRQSMP